MKYSKESTQDSKRTSRYRVGVLRERCKGCGFCIEFCPRKVLRESSDFNTKGYHPACAEVQDNCTDCGLCELICPEFAIDVVPLEKEKVRG